VLTSARRPEHAFGFQMFGESSAVRVSLLREIDAPSGHGTLLVPAPRGEWTVQAGDSRRLVAFHDRVKEPFLSTFDAFFDAPYGAAAEIARLQAALDDVDRHLDGDPETRRLVADVTVKKNGREPTVIRLVGAPRAEASQP